MRIDIRGGRSGARGAARTARSSKRPRWALALCAAALGAAAGGPGAPHAVAKEVTIKIATLAPEGTSWMNVMQELDAELRARTKGAVGFKFYPGGVAGDEKVVLKKIRIGQLQGGAFTGMGLGEIHSWVRILEVPFLFRSYEEVDCVRERIEERLRAEYEKRGFVVIGWAESGVAHLFSNRRLMNVEDVRASKPWVWEGDPLASAAFHAFGVNPTPLALPDVLTSLQTGLIDTVYVSPMACIGLQWFGKVKYMTSEPISDGQGAIIVQKAALDRLSPEHRAIVLELGRKHGDRLREIARKENAEALPTLCEKGIEVLQWSPKDVEGLFAVGEKVAAELAGEGPGKLYPPALLDEVRGLLRELRASKGARAQPSGAGSTGAPAPAGTQGSAPPQ